MKGLTNHRPLLEAGKLSTYNHSKAEGERIVSALFPGD